MARIVRAALALLFCFAAVAVLFQMAAINNWGDFQVRAPIFALVPWAYASKPKSRVVVVLCAISLVCIGGAALTIALPSWLLGSHPSVFNALGGIGFIALAAALAGQAWLTIWGWRADRRRLRANSPGRLERLSGGF